MDSEDNKFKEMQEFIQDLPHKYKIELSAYIYEGTYRNLHFLKDKSGPFIAWFCPLLKGQVRNNHEYIHFEGDDITDMYFFKKGGCGYVLPKHLNVMFVKITKGYSFGFIDIIHNIQRYTDINN